MAYATREECIKAKKWGCWNTPRPSVEQAKVAKDKRKAAKKARKKNRRK